MSARAFSLCLLAAAGIQAPSIFDAILAEPGQRTGEISTAELKKILAERSAIVLDARPGLSGFTLDLEDLFATLRGDLQD